MKNSERLTSTAYHESGHVVALILIKKKFKFVQIKVKGGNVRRVRPLNTELWETKCFFNPVQNHKFFELSFVTVAGFISESIYRKRGNYRGAMSDLRVWVFIVLNHLPKELRRPFQKYIINYTEQVLKQPDNWHIVETIAQALLERKILTYKEVLDLYNKS